MYSYRGAARVTAIAVAITRGEGEARNITCTNADSALVEGAVLTDGVARFAPQQKRRASNVCAVNCHREKKWPCLSQRAVAELHRRRRSQQDARLAELDVWRQACVPARLLTQHLQAYLGRPDVLWLELRFGDDVQCHLRHFASGYIGD